MSEDDEYGAQKLVVLIGSLLAFATLCVIFSVSIFHRISKKCKNEISLVTCAHSSPHKFLVLQNLYGRPETKKTAAVSTE